MYELFIPDEVILEHIAANKPLQELRTLISNRGHRSLIDDGFEKAASGLTTVQEVMRVAAS